MYTKNFYFQWSIFNSHANFSARKINKYYKYAIYMHFEELLMNISEKICLIA